MIRHAGGREDRVLAPVPPINRVLRVMLHTHWSVEARSEVRVQFRRAVALGIEIRRGSATPGRTPHRFAQRGERGFGLGDQAIC